MWTREVLNTYVELVERLEVDGDPRAALLRERLVLVGRAQFVEPTWLLDAVQACQDAGSAALFRYLETTYPEFEPDWLSGPCRQGFAGMEAYQEAVACWLTDETSLIAQLERNLETWLLTEDRMFGTAFDPRRQVRRTTVRNLRSLLGKTAPVDRYRRAEPEQPRKVV